MMKISKRWIPTQKCAGLTYTESKPAKLSDTQGAFIVFGFGLVASAIAFAAEFVYFYLKKHKKQNIVTAGTSNSEFIPSAPTRVQSFRDTD
jgi:hypothetical protein